MGASITSTNTYVRDVVLVTLIAWVMHKNRTVTGIIASDYIYQQVSAMQDNDLLTDRNKNTVRNSLQQNIYSLILYYKILGYYS
jgi:hypothetical protein